MICFFCISILLPAEGTAGGWKQNRERFAGLRRSSYGLSDRNGNNQWWAERATAYAGMLNQFDPDKHFSPAMIEIVSIFLDNGKTKFEFSKPATYKGGTENMTFRDTVSASSVDHEQALTIYDLENISVFLQLEPGFADVADGFDIIFKAFGHHQCIKGFGVDAEWYRHNNGLMKEGKPVSDEEARSWMNKVTALNPSYMLFIKHWKTTHMPPSYRHPGLWFLSDSQNFEGLEEMLLEFEKWGKTFNGNDTGYQFGYKSDKKWWQGLPYPHTAIALSIFSQLPETRFLFWVDFTADQVLFSLNHQ